MTYEGIVSFSTSLHASCRQGTYMFGPILERVGQFFRERCVFLQCLAPLDGASNGMSDDATLLLFYQQLGTCPHYLEIVTVDIE
jgi:hypothetical protein